MPSKSIGRATVTTTKTGKAKLTPAKSRTPKPLAIGKRKTAERAEAAWSLKSKPRSKK